MIVRNEERFLEECLKSIKNAVDEIVIVDTGSTDRTKEIASSFGARIFDFPWNGDFAAARNKAISHSRGEWILYIDADERLRPADKSYINKILSDPGKVGYTVRFHPVIGYTAYREYRIFRNDPRIRFEGVIHESMVQSLNAVEKSDGLVIGKADLTIDHTGYEGDMTRKHARNMPMLERQIENDPGRIYLRWQLGISRMGLGDEDGAEKAWKDAIGIIRAKKNVTHEDSHPYYEMIRLKIHRDEDPWELLSEALGLFPRNYLLIWTRAKILMHGGRFEEAVPVFEFLASIAPDKLEGESLAYNAEIFGELTYEPLAACYFKLGKFSESEKYYSLATECAPENQEYRTKLMFIRALLDKS